MYGFWSIVHGLWSMVHVMAYGLWFMVYGLWLMVYGSWFSVQVLGFRDYGLGITFYGLWLRVCEGFVSYGLWFMVFGLWAEVRDLCYRLTKRSRRAGKVPPEQRRMGRREKCCSRGLACRCRNSHFLKRWDDSRFQVLLFPSVWGIEGIPGFPRLLRLNACPSTPVEVNHPPTRPCPITPGPELPSSSSSGAPRLSSAGGNLI